MKAGRTRKSKTTKPPKVRYRYGIGEWYGKVFVTIDPAERARLADLQFQTAKDRPVMPCPFRQISKVRNPACKKAGGVCTLRLYQLDPSSRLVTAASGAAGALVTLCPYRFQEAGLIYKWIGETLLDTAGPIVVSELGFLEQPVEEDLEATSNSGEDVGRIDSVLVHPSLTPLVWCALEMQAVYFSGSAMKQEFEVLRVSQGKEVLFPAAHRRPDYRSSGPKRLMPQLQIKVPALRRWGKKMAVVVDRSFFDSLGKMDHVKDVSNSDIAWFIVRYEEVPGTGAILKPDEVRFTTLERAVEGLTGGTPIGVSEFESRIRAKLAAKT